MPYEFKINALKFRAADGEDVSIVPKKIVVFVGPNNAGKSTALKEIRRAVLNEDDYYGNVYSNSDAESHSSNCIFSSIDLPNPKSAEEVISSLGLDSKVHRSVDGSWRNSDCCDFGLEIDPMGSYRRNTFHPRQSIQGIDWKTYLQALIGSRDYGDGVAKWDKGGFYSFVGPSLINYMGTEERLLFSIGAQYKGYLDLDSNFLSTTAFNVDLYENLSKETNAQFGKGVYPDTESRGGIVSLRSSCGKRSKTDSFLKDEGDGFRSFVATYLALAGGSRPLLLLDEPEAFLHPPQARRLAQIIGEVSGSQVFVATHSEEILKGLMTACPDELTIVRIGLVDGKRYYSIVDPSSIAELFSSSLHFSNIIDALFSKGALLVEGKDDAVLVDALFDTLGLADAPICIGVMGKSNFPKAAEFLQSAGVPFAVLADFDVLKDKNHYSKVVKCLGGSDNDVREIVQTSNAAIGKMRDLGIDFRKNVSLSLERSDSDLACQINALLTRLSDLGFWVLPDGELESCLGNLVPYSANKDAWLNAALSFVANAENRVALRKAEISLYVSRIIERLK